jgi:hypothetical protein
MRRSRILRLFFAFFGDFDRNGDLTSTARLDEETVRLDGRC